MPRTKDYIAKIEGICGGEGDIIVSLKRETKDAVIAHILKRCVVRKSHSTFMFELELDGVVFRLFNNGRIVFRGMRNRRTLNKVLAAILL